MSELSEKTPPEKKPAPIVNINDLTLNRLPSGMSPTGEAAERYGSRMAAIAPRLGAKQLGYNLTEIDPGKCAFPYHAHRVNEEVFYIVSGEGELRYGDERYPVGPGDIIACPAGGAETAHQIRNTGLEPLRFLAVSTRLTPELAEYPDSGKFGVMAQYQSADGKPEMFLHVGKREQNLGYWD